MMNGDNKLLIYPVYVVVITINNNHYIMCATVSWNPLFERSLVVRCWVEGFARALALGTTYSWRANQGRPKRKNCLATFLGRSATVVAASIRSDLTRDRDEQSPKIAIKIASFNLIKAAVATFVGTVFLFLLWWYIAPTFMIYYWKTDILDQ